MEITPSGDDIFKAVRQFLVAVLPPGTPVKQGEVNRTPEPKLQNYAVMWLLMMPRLATNLDEYADCVFTGSVADDTLTVTEFAPGFPGSLGVGSVVFGADVATGTTVTAVVSAPSGGPWVYTVTPDGQTVASETMASGLQSVTQTAEVVVQVDVHGPLSLQNSAAVATLFRDQYAVDVFAANGSTLSPFYADDPRQTPFINGESQVEKRLSVDLHMQADFTVNVPQQFADAVDFTIVDATALPL